MRLYVRKYYGPKLFCPQNVTEKTLWVVAATNCCYYELGQLQIVAAMNCPCYELSLLWIVPVINCRTDPALELVPIYARSGNTDGGSGPSALAALGRSISFCISLCILFYTSFYISFYRCFSFCISICISVYIYILFCILCCISFWI